MRLTAIAGPNASSIQATTFLTFEQNDIFVPDYELAFINAWTPQARISAYGFRTDTGVCAVTASFSVEYGASDVKGGFDGSERFSFPISVSVFEGSAIFTNSVNVNDQLRDFFTGEVADYIGRVISVRRSEEMRRYLEAFPPSGEQPMSKKEWDEMRANMREVSDG